MIIGIGIDAITINRFETIKNLPCKQLLRIYTQQELDYCFADQKYTNQRLAARFAAREATFKAFSQAYPDHTIPFLTLCRAITIVKKRGPTLSINYFLISNYLPDGERQSLGSIITHLSLTHTSELASAFIILEKGQNKNLFI